MEDLLQQEASDPQTSPERLQWLATEHPALQLLIAANPAAPPEWLASLRQNTNTALRREAVKNPNTPIQTLFLMGAEFPQDLLANPTFSLSFLENPDLFRKVHNHLLAAIAPLPELPLPLMQKAVYEHEHIRRQASKNPSLTEEFAFYLAGDERFDIRQSTFKNSSLSPEKRELLRRLGVSPDHQAPQPADKNLSAQELAICCQSGGFAQWMVARHPNVTVDQLERISGSAYLMAVAGAARNEKTPAATLLKIYEKNLYNDQVAVGLLENPNLPLEIVNQFAARSNTPHAYKIALAARPELSAAQLEAFSKSGRISVRAAVAKNPSTPAHVLSALSADTSGPVRIALASHPNLPDADVTILSKDKSSAVRYQVTRRTVLTEGVIRSLRETRSMRELESLARRRELSPEILSSLLLMQHARVFLAALQNPNTPKEFAALISRLRGKQSLTEEERAFLFAHSKDSKILLAEHPQISLTQLQEMVNSDDALLYTAVARSPNVTPELLRGLLQKALNEEGLMTAAKRLASLGEPVELSNERLKQLPEWLRGRLARKLQKKQQREAARAETTTIEELEALAKQNEKELLHIIATRKGLPLAAIDWFKGRFVRKLLENEDFTDRLSQSPEVFYQLPLKVLLSVVSHPKLPEIFLRWSCAHSSLEVRLAASKNPNISSALLQMLANSTDLNYSLRRSIAQHPNTPKELLGAFLQSADPWLKIWAERRLT
jgi:hypothetical protein